MVELDADALGAGRQLTHRLVVIVAPPVGIGDVVAEGAPPWLAALTPRETDVLRATARGLSNKEIARELELAEVTIKLHLSAVFRKMGVRSRTEAAMMAVKTGIL